MKDSKLQKEKESFLHNLSILSRKYKIGIVGNFELKKLPEEQCGVLDHGYYDFIEPKAARWHG